MREGGGLRFRCRDEERYREAARKTYCEQARLLREKGRGRGGRGRGEEDHSEEVRAKVCQGDEARARHAVSLRNPPRRGLGYALCREWTSCPDEVQQERVRPFGGDGGGRPRVERGVATTSRLASLMDEREECGILVLRPAEETSMETTQGQAGLTLREGRR